jgi:hypothetical protein
VEADGEQEEAGRAAGEWVAVLVPAPAARAFALSAATDSLMNGGSPVIRRNVLSVALP